MSPSPLLFVSSICSLAIVVVDVVVVVAVRFFSFFAFFWWGVSTRSDAGLVTRLIFSLNTFYWIDRAFHDLSRNAKRKKMKNDDWNFGHHSARGSRFKKVSVVFFFFKVASPTSNRLESSRHTVDRKKLGKITQ